MKNKKIFNMIYICVLIMSCFVVSFYMQNKIEAAATKTQDALGNWHYSDYVAADTTNYYTNLTGLNQTQFTSRLNTIISANTTKISYGGGDNQTLGMLKKLDEHPLNSSNVFLMYSGASEAKSLGNGTGASAWNTEHTWAKSHGFPSESWNAYSDLHHLRATYSNINSTRSSMDFDYAKNHSSSPKDASYGNYYVANTVFEPRDGAKGDVARMMMYMDVRYAGLKSGDPTLTLLRSAPNAGSTTGSGIFGNLTTLLKWHMLDPVDDYERSRNDKIFVEQGNRNPFIDHPEYIEQVYGEDYIIDEDELTDQEAADLVIDAIAQIGVVTLEKAYLITTAENAYIKLTEVQKGLVTNYQILVSARLTYDELLALENHSDIDISFVVDDECDYDIIGTQEYGEMITINIRTENLFKIYYAVFNGILFEPEVTAEGYTFSFRLYKNTIIELGCFFEEEEQHIYFGEGNKFYGTYLQKTDVVPNDLVGANFVKWLEVAKIDNVTYYKAEYQVKEKEYTVTTNSNILLNGVQRLSNKYKFGDVAILSSAIYSENIAWKINGKILSYEPVLEFFVTADCNVELIITTEEDPISIVEEKYLYSENALVIYGRYNNPTEELIETGVIIFNEYVANISITNPNVVVLPVQNINRRGEFVVTYKLPLSASGLGWYMVPYYKTIESDAYIYGDISESKKMELAIKYAYSHLQVNATVESDFELQITTIYNKTIVWTSSNEDAIKITGEDAKVTRLTESQIVTLSAYIDGVLIKTYQVTVTSITMSLTQSIRFDVTADFTTATQQSVASGVSATDFFRFGAGNNNTVSAITTNSGKSFTLNYNRVAVTFLAMTWSSATSEKPQIRLTLTPISGGSAQVGSVILLNTDFITTGTLQTIEFTNLRGEYTITLEILVGSGSNSRAHIAKSGLTFTPIY